MKETTKRQPRLKNLDELFLLNGGVNPLDVPVSVIPPAPTDSEYKIVAFSLMDDFPGHPFRLYEGERETDMMESIQAKGILQPLILRAMVSGRYQILSGHNRRHTGEKAGLTEAPAIIKRNLSNDEAWIYVVETNLMQRSFSDMSHSEKAAVIATQHSKLFSQGKRNDILAELQHLEKPHDIKENETCAQLGHKLKSREIIATDYGLSRNTVARYLRINQLIPSLKTLLDNGKIAFITAVTLSFLKEDEQQSLYRTVELNGFSVDMKKAELLRKFSEEGKLTDTDIYLILNGEIGQKPKPNRTPTVKVSKSTYAKYFKSNQSAREIQETVEKALDYYYEHMKSQ